MKNTRILLLLLTIALILGGCSSGDEGSATPTKSPAENFSANNGENIYTYPSAPTVLTTPTYVFAPEASFLPEDIPSASPAQTEAPTVQPDGTQPTPTVPSVIAPAAPSSTALAGITGYSSVSSDSLGLTMQYPTGWVNKPGRYTICYEQPVTGNTFPARIAVTVKTVKHTPDEEEEVLKEFRSFFQSIATMYEKDDFVVNDQLEETTLLGQYALASTYVTTYGDTEVKGYCAITAVGRKLCVYHFACPYDDYSTADALRVATRDSVRLLTDN